MNSITTQPQSKFVRRLPVMLYRLGFAPLLGVMPFLVLTTRGQGGTMRFTPLEYRRHGSRMYVLATENSVRWLNRVREDPIVTITIGTRSFPASADIVTDEAEAVRALFQFRMSAPPPLRYLYWSGRNASIMRADQFKDTARRYTFVRLERLPGHTFALPAVPADRAWITALVLMALGFLTAVLLRQKRSDS